MIALDTNVVVRLLVNDDAAQARRSRALMAAGHEVRIPVTVLLEAEWVLRAAYGYPAPQVMTFLQALLGLPGVSTDNATAVAGAIAACEKGLDFADALHLALSGGAERFYSFDANLRRRAARAMPGVQVSAPG
jgi:predicted nucleic-acid-binding protein